MVIALSLLIAVIGLLMYALANPASKLVEIGRCMFWTGLLAFLLRFSGPLGIAH